MRKKTAVEWLVEQVNSDCLNSTFIQKKLVEQAREMEKEQMLGFYKWMKVNDTENNAEKYFHYSDEDMLKEYHNETYERATGTE
jgi:hypothetical protein